MPDPAPGFLPSARKRLGELAMERGLLSGPNLEDALNVQRRMKELGLPELLGEILVQKKYLTRGHLEELLRENQGGRRLGNFEILSKIGQGAMGVVFKARQLSMDRLVALKILAPKFAADPVFIERFVREARAAGQFSHPHIVTALDVGYAAPYHYLAMEYVDGEDLRRVLKRGGPLPEARALEIVHQVALALEHALRKNVIHRDVKPENIMLEQGGAAKLLDMGLACAANVEERQQGGDGRAGSGTRRAVGTPHYIAPEAAQGLEDVDTRADIYSLGCTLYHLLTGQTPFQGASSAAVMARHICEEVPDPRLRRAELSAATAALLARMTARDRALRHPDPSTLATELRALLDGRALHPVGGRIPPLRQAQPVREQTGPRAPIGSQGTTGPRRPVSPRTTGPAAPIRGDRTGPHAPAGLSGSPNGTKPLARKSSGGLLWPGLGVAAAVLVVAVVLGRGSTPAQPAPALAVKPAPGTNGASGAIVPARGPAVPSGEKAAPGLGEERQQQARKALEDAVALEREGPERFERLLPACREACRVAAGTPLAAQAQAQTDAVRARWLERLRAHLEGLRQAAEGALGRQEYQAGLEALDPGRVPEALRVEDWARQVDEVSKGVRERIGAEGARWLAEGRGLVQRGGLQDLEAALVLAARAAQLPGVPELRVEAGRLRGEWEAALAQARAAAQRAFEEDQARGREAFFKLRKELLPELVRNRFVEVLAILEDRRARKESAGSAVYLDRELANLQALLLLRGEALLNLRKRAGEGVSLRKGPLAIEGQVQAGGPPGTLTLKIPKGPEMLFGPRDLEAGDVDRWASWPEGEQRGSGLRLRGLNFLYAGRYQDAARWLGEAALAGQEQLVRPDLEWLAWVELSEAEWRATQAWEQAGRLDQARNWKGALSAYEAFRREHGATKFAEDHKARLEERLREIGAILNPYRPGLLGCYFKGLEFEAPAVVLRRIDAAVQFEWGAGSPDRRVPEDQFCVRWEGFLKIEKAGSYRLATLADDGQRLWVDGKQLFEDWKDHSPTRAEGTLVLEAGYHPLKLEFYENGGGASIQLLWSREGEGGFAEEALPARVLWHQPAQEQGLTGN